MEVSFSDLTGNAAGGIDPLLLLGVALVGLSLAGVALLALLRRRGEVRRRAAGESGPQAGEGRGASARRALAGLVASVEPLIAAGDDGTRRLIRLRLVQAGCFDASAVPLFFAARIVAALAGGVAGALLSPLVSDQMEGANLALAVAAGAMVGWYTPNAWLARRIAGRVAVHREGFPDFMDLMVVCAEAGLTMEAAVERIAREFVEGHPSLAENLYIASLEVRAGTPLGAALERLGQRLGLEEAATFATLLQQSAELGTSLSHALRVYSEEMRSKRLGRAEEKAYALPSKLVVPLTVFVFPVLIVVLLYPAGVRVMSGMAT